MISRIINKLKRKEGAFAIAVFANKRQTFDEFDEQHLIYKSVISGLWKPKPILFQADSFLFVKGNKLYLFYELQHWDDPGHIAMIQTSDLKTWTSPKIVLKEPFHLSFPFVFEDNGKYYMIPESQEANSIRLYQANDNLTKFTYVKTLLKQANRDSIHYNYCDSHIFKSDGKYYLFTSYQKNWVYYQELYVTSDLLHEDFVRHPKSPICISNEFGRNGGSLIMHKGGLYRVTQDCHSSYGDNISLMKINKLSETEYEEGLYLKNIFPHNSIFIDGGHQLNIAIFNNLYIYATDYKINKWAWYRPYISILTKLGLHKKT